MRGIYFSVFCLALALCMQVLSGAIFVTFAQSLNRVVAVVNGEMITQRELDKVVAPELLHNKLDPKNPAHAEQISQLQRIVLDNMITERILGQEAARLGLEVSEDMLNNEMDIFISSSGLSPENFEKQLVAEGLTLDIMQARLKSNIITQMLIGREVLNKVVVTENEVTDYFRANNGNISGISHGSQVRVALLVYPPNIDAQSWAARIANGSISFEEVARQVSQGPNPQAGGDMGFLPMEDLAPSVRQIMETLQTGQVSPVLDMGQAKAQIRLLEVSSNSGGPSVDSQEVPDAPTAAQIENVLREPRLEARFAEYTEQLVKKAIIDVRL